MYSMMSKGYTPQHRPGSDYFLSPASPSQRQYEALRAYLVEGQSAEDAARRFGYTTATLYSLCRELRAGRLRFFHPVKPGPKEAPKKEAARKRVIELRKRNYSVYDIRDILRSEGLSLSHVLISQILKEEGFAKLPRRADDERPLRPRPDVAEIADVRELDWRKFATFETEGTALFVLLPTLIDWGIHRWVSRSGLPGSKMIPALQSVLSLLSLKLVGKERISHVMDVCFDPGFALFAGLNVPPKTTALSTYSYRVTRDMTASLLENYAKVLRAAGAVPGQSFNLDFHAIPHRGEEAVLEKHYVSKRSRAERALLAFLVQDNDSQMLCYANATVRKEDAAEEILNFVDFWERVHGKRPPHLVFDSRLTTYAVLNRLDKQEILFITLRRRGPAVMRTLKELPKSTWTKMSLKGVSRRYKHVHYTENSAFLRGIDRPLRQIAVRGLGHEEPTLFLTNDMQSKPVALVERYARRMLIENSIAENVDFFHLDALSSAVALQVDLDVMLTLIANALYRHLAAQLTGFETAKPKQIFRRFLNTPARVTVSKNEVRVRIRRSAHHPILLASGALNTNLTVPWWQGRRLRLEIR
jgi:transposase